MNQWPSNPLQNLLQQIARIQQMERGKLCIMRQGPSGPYYSHQTWENGKNVSRYVPQEQVAELQEALEGYQTFQRLVDQYAELLIKKTWDQRSASKKKTPARPSSLPRRKRSRS